ncbi:MAG: hypothetical protein H7Y15_03810 [Pseudonocardia sp.]|nr:hypothetical protein [Pseudonocardia sp.]
MALLCALVVVALGLLADVAAAVRASTGAGSPAGDGSSLTEVAGSSGQVVGPLRR